MGHLIKTYIVDAFTDKPFNGNPAGVCLIEKDLDDALMISIAGELGLSETAFVKKFDEPNRYFIRYFSPKMEIPLCGHATLAASEVLFRREVSLHKINFVNIQNIHLLVEKVGGSIKMEFPVYETKPDKAPQKLLNALGIEILQNVEFNEETKILLIEIDDSQFLNQMKPDFQALYDSHKNINGVLVTAPSNKKEYDFESRYFWPWSGTNEDPVTGATHTFLTKYWSKRLGKTKMKSFQCSKRTGFMEVELEDKNRLIIKSAAKIIFEGGLML